MAKHITLSQRIIIESNLNDNIPFRQIGENIGKSHTTISREVLARRILVKGNSFNALNMKCNKTEKAPFVCNGCPNKKSCRKNKYFYYAKDAENDYRKTLVESREGIDFLNNDFRNMDKIIKEEVDKGHSFYMIIEDHPEFEITERTLYYYQEKGYLSTKNIDLPRKVRYKKRKRKTSKSKSERKEQTCRIGRTYEDFEKEVIDKNIDYYVEMDTVEGIKGHSVLLTLCIIPFNLLLAYKLEEQSIVQVTNSINKLKNELGYLLFHQIFPYILTDNGKEFKRPDLIENNGQDVIQTKVFFCDARSSEQKGTIEVTHEYIRRFIPQGIDLDSYTQDDINLMINHINNTKRKKLDGKTPLELFTQKFDEEATKKLGLYYIAPNDIILKPSLFNNKHNK